MRISHMTCTLFIIIFLTACNVNKKMSAIELRARDEPCSTTLYKNNVIKYKFTSLGNHIVEPGEYYVDMICKDGPYHFIAHCYPNEIAELNAADFIPLHNAGDHSPSGHIISLTSD